MFRDWGRIGNNSEEPTLFRSGVWGRSPMATGRSFLFFFPVWLDFGLVFFWIGLLDWMFLGLVIPFKLVVFGGYLFRGWSFLL